MNSFGKVILVGILAIFGVYVAFGVLKTLLGTLFALLIPVAVLGAVGYGIYRLAGGHKGLPGNNRTLP